MRRTSVGNELSTNPSCIFLDEPTSGLDAFLAYQVVKTLRNLAKSDVTVCLTIHQPSSEIIDLFDEFIIMQNGQLIMQGDKASLLTLMDSIGFPCVENYNLLDHILFQIQQMDQTKLDEVMEAEKIKRTKMIIRPWSQKFSDLV
eukprot:UN24324